MDLNSDAKGFIHTTEPENSASTVARVHVQLLERPWYLNSIWRYNYFRFTVATPKTRLVINIAQCSHIVSSTVAKHDYKQDEITWYELIFHNHGFQLK